MALTKTNSRLTVRFSGRNGLSKRVAAMESQFLVAGDKNVAQLLVKKATLSEFSKGQEVLRQGDFEDDLWFIFGGSVEILVNQRVVAIREAGDHVGEIGLLDTTAVRSATVRALEDTVLARVSEADFTKIATQNPLLWRRIALGLAKRLKERNKFQAPKRQQAAVFIGSSSEGLDIAKQVYAKLLRQKVVPVLWSQGVFECSKTTIEDLVRVSGESDFAIIVLTADDVTRSRGRAKRSPRDNVIFELGLFMGAITRERTYIVAPKGIDLKLPTDLLGVTYLSFQFTKGVSLSVSLKPVIAELRKLIKRHGPL